MSVFEMAEAVRLARHREPHKCPREDVSSACDFNRYGVGALRAAGMSTASLRARAAATRAMPSLDAYEALVDDLLAALPDAFG